ncbi:family 43 glycosylhydrolase [Labilibaculum sp.]|uniref:family 43 glycosylhydrolase n=1 Tax=Labilibaculum sp. TaxID=2060723 RepID=UPI002AA6881A|nr:family 43 glycosylhydrolase [Labilibaculum sp.]
MLKKGLYLLLLIFPFCLNGQETGHKIQGIDNPLLPGYFADPTIKKFGDTFYLYSTTDGIKLASGEPQVWVSKDFVNWYNTEMDIELPDGLTNCWAPDVMKGKDGKYYYFMGNCEHGCNIYAYVSDSPIGPWKSLKNGQAVIPVGTAIKGLPALDAQYFLDDDGSIYSYFGTWCSSFGGLGWAKIDPKDHCTILESGSIPITQIPEVFEAAYLLKHNGKYILMYSSGDCRLSSYAVHYSYSDSPVGPFHYGDNSPILKTNQDGSIDSPGHHSVLKDGDDYYILYHRHDNPHSTGGEFRQVCADRLDFLNDSTILPVIPTHKGIGYLRKNQIPEKDLAFKAKTTATSYYHLESPATKYTNSPVDYKYLPEYATDNNNGTMWKAASSTYPQSLVVDLGKKVKVARVMTQFEYSTFYYQYRIECSSDSINWSLFSDRTNNRQSGSPMIDDNNALNTRYVKLTVTAAEKGGLFPAIWNLKVYPDLFEIPELALLSKTSTNNVLTDDHLLMNFDVENFVMDSFDYSFKNSGSLAGYFMKEGTPKIKYIDNVKAISFDGESYFRLSESAPNSLSWNSSYTVSSWVFNPEIGDGECLITWNSRENMLQGSYSALMYGKSNFGAVAHGDGSVDLAYKEIPEASKWHHIALSFDGMVESVYVDGVLNTQQPINLFVKNSDILIGASGLYAENYIGYISNSQLFNRALTVQEIIELMKITSPDK